MLLINDEETALVDYLDCMSLRGFPFDRTKCRELIREMAMRNGKIDRLGKHGPTDKWFCGFYGRHPQLPDLKTTKMEHKRITQSNDMVINHWFDLLGRYKS